MSEYRKGMPTSPAEKRALVVLADAGMIPHEYSVKCYDCPKPWTMEGGMRIDVIRRAEAHARKRVGHTAYMLDYGLHIGKRVYEPMEETEGWGE